MNVTERYRLETLAELGACFPETVPAADVAQRRGIPPAYLAQLVREMAHRALIQTRRGPGGGLRLAREPREVPLDRVLVPEPTSEGCSVIESRLLDVLEGALGNVTVADLVAWEHEAAPVADYVI